MSFQMNFLLALFTFSVMGCGASKVPSSTDLASRGGSSNSLPGSSSFMAECNSIPNGNLQLQGSLATYYNPSSGQYISNQIQMIITSPPSELATNGNHYIQIFRWTMTQNGQRELNSLPVRMYFMQRGTGGISNSSPLEAISKSAINQMIADKKLDAFGITTSNFLERHIIILTGMDLKWEAITLAYYDNQQGQQAIQTQDVLLPPFLANPNSYRLTRNIPSLYILHPLNSIQNSGASDQEFFQRTEELCYGFFSAFSRVPSSVDQPSSPIRNWLTSIKEFMLKVKTIFLKFLK